MDALNLLNSAKPTVKPKAEKVSVSNQYMHFGAEVISFRGENKTLSDIYTTIKTEAKLEKNTEMTKYFISLYEMLTAEASKQTANAETKTPKTPK